MELAGLRVLLVEDEGMIVMLARSILETIGCEVVGEQFFSEGGFN